MEGSGQAFTMAPSLVRNMGLIVTVGLPRNDFHIPIGASLLSARGMYTQSFTTKPRFSSFANNALRTYRHRCGGRDRGSNVGASSTRLCQEDLAKGYRGWFRSGGDGFGGPQTARYNWKGRSENILNPWPQEAHRSPRSRSIIVFSTICC